MTSAEELKENIGKTAMLTVSGSPLRFAVTILDARSRYGHLDYRVTPVSGDGETWHADCNVTVLDKTN